MSDVIPHPQFSLEFISAAFCVYQSKRVPALAVIYTICYGFHRSFVIPDNPRQRIFLFKLLVCVTAVWLDKFSLVIGKIAL